MDNKSKKNYGDILSRYTIGLITITASVITIFQVVASLSIWNNDITSALIDFFKAMNIETKVAVFIALECFLAWFFSATLAIFCKDYLKDKISPQHIMVIFIWLALSTWVSIYNVKIIIISKLGILYGKELFLSLVMIIVAYLFAIWMIKNHFKENENNLSRFKAIQTVCFAIYFFAIIFFGNINSNKKNINVLKDKLSASHVVNSGLYVLQKKIEKEEDFLKKINKSILSIFDSYYDRYDKDLSDDLQKQKAITQKNIQNLEKKIEILKSKISLTAKFKLDSAHKEDKSKLIP